MNCVEHLFYLLKVLTVLTLSLSLSLSLRQLGSDGHGFPIFEIYFAEANGGYNLQVRA
jgi:hypothetical protein